MVDIVNRLLRVRRQPVPGMLFQKLLEGLFRQGVIVEVILINFSDGEQRFRPVAV